MVLVNIIGFRSMLDVQYCGDAVTAIHSTSSSLNVHIQIIWMWSALIQAYGRSQIGRNYSLPGHIFYLIAPHYLVVASESDIPQPFNQFIKGHVINIITLSITLISRPWFNKLLYNGYYINKCYVISSIFIYVSRVFDLAPIKAIQFLKYRAFNIKWPQIKTIWN